MKKKLLAMLLVVVLAFSLLTTVAMAGGETLLTEADGTEYRLNGRENQSGNGWDWNATTQVLTLNGFHGQSISDFGYWGKKIVIADGSSNSLSNYLSFSPSNINGANGGVTVEGTGTLIIDQISSGYNSKNTYNALSINEFYGPVTIVAPLQLTGGMKVGDNDPLTLEYDEDTRNINFPYAGYKGTGYPVTAVGSKAQYVRIGVAGSTSTKPETSTIPASGTAYPAIRTVDVDGKTVTFRMYALADANGNQTNYIKIRDLALALNGEAIELDSILLLDDNDNGHTYCQVKDLALKLNFNAHWDSARGIICIETDKPYSGN